MFLRCSWGPHLLGNRQTVSCVPTHICTQLPPHSARPCPYRMNSELLLKRVPYLTLTGYASPVEENMALLTQAVYDLAKLYLRSFCPPSVSLASPPLPQAADQEAAEARSSREASGTTDHLQFTLFALHGIPANWVSRYAI